MKKIIAFFALLFIVAISFAQVQRKKNVVNKADSANGIATDKKISKADKRDLMRELNLSKDQKSKLKEARQTAKAKKAAIENDDKLSEADKQTKLKLLKREQAKNTMGILNDEQKEKMKKIRKDKKGQPMEEGMEEMEEQ